MSSDAPNPGMSTIIISLYLWEYPYCKVCVQLLAPILEGWRVPVSLFSRKVLPWPSFPTKTTTEGVNMFELDNSFLLCSRIGGCIREYCRYLQFYTFARIVSSFPQHSVEGQFCSRYVDTPNRCRAYTLYCTHCGHIRIGPTYWDLTDQSVPAAKYPWTYCSTWTHMLHPWPRD